VTLHDEAGGADEAQASHPFIFIGAAPMTGWLPADVRRDDAGFVLSGPDLGVAGALRCTGTWKDDEVMTEPGPTRLAPDELRMLFLFEFLDEDKLAWLAGHGRVEGRRGGTMVYTEGEPATCFFVLLEGTIPLRRRVGDTDVELTRTNQRGAHSGAMQATCAPTNPCLPGIDAVSGPGFRPHRDRRHRTRGAQGSDRIVVQRHGGDLTVVSEPGDTRFQVRLPVHAPASFELPTGRKTPGVRAVQPSSPTSPRPRAIERTEMSMRSVAEKLPIKPGSTL